MPSIDRTLIIAGPAIVAWGGQTFWSKGNVTVKPAYQKFDVSNSAFGKVDTRFSSKQLEVTFEPDGRFNAALAAVLWPYGATALGASIYGATDAALTVHGRDGVKITLANAAVTEMPTIRLGAAQTICGSIKFAGILSNSTSPDAVGAYYTVASEAYPGDDGWLAGDIPTAVAASAWGDTSPWASFLTEAGWEIQFALGLTPQNVDGLGVVDMRLTGLDVTARCIPVGPAMADVLEKMGEETPLGSSLAALGADLELTTSAAVVTVKGAAITDCDFQWGLTPKRLGTTVWTATRTITEGVADPLFTVEEFVVVPEP